jgi:transposase-like protein
MDRQILKGYLEQGLSLSRIGALVGLDPSTVGYWVQSTGSRPTAAPSTRPEAP